MVYNKFKKALKFIKAKTFHYIVTLNHRFNMHKAKINKDHKKDMLVQLIINAITINLVLYTIKMELLYSELVLILDHQLGNIILRIYFIPFISNSFTKNNIIAIKQHILFMEDKIINCTMDLINN